MSILFISDPLEDAHLLPVAAELGRRGHEVAIFNPGLLPSSATVSVEFAAGRQRTTLLWADGQLALADVTGVWYRRPGNFRLADQLSSAEADWLRGECADLVRGIWANLDATWVSAPGAIREANHKLLQLRLATELGFRIPDTLVTNDPLRALDFVQAHPGGVIVKGLAAPTLIEAGYVGMVYTHRLAPDDLAHLGAVAHGPTFFQGLVPKGRDLRVTVIGDDLFAVAIDATRSAAGTVDFRRAAIMDLPHEPITLPGALRDACLALVRRLGLRYGAIDLLLTPDGDYIFLEINPNGQWLWIEMVTGLPLTRAMADLLAQGATPTRTPHPPTPTRPPRALPVGPQTVPFPTPTDPARTLDFAGTRLWLERRRGQILLHVGDSAVEDGTGECERLGADSSLRSA